MSVLHTLTSITQRSAKRVGRGVGSGKGSHTSGRGMKGHRSRVGKPIPLWFEGGQLPLIKRLPMQRGKARFNVVRPTAEITLGQLDGLAKNEAITLETLKLAGLVERGYARAKVIANGTLTKKVSLKGIRTSAAARAAIEKLGGSVA